MNDYSISQLMQSVQGMVRIATVKYVDPASARAKVSFGGETESAWIPWTAERGSTIKSWAPPAEGEQVLVLSEAGNTANGVIVGAVFSAGNAAPSSDGEAYRVEIGGSSIEMTADGITLTSNGSSLELNSMGITLNGARIDLNE